MPNVSFDIDQYLLHSGPPTAHQAPGSDKVASTLTLDLPTPIPTADEALLSQIMTLGRLRSPSSAPQFEHENDLTGTPKYRRKGAVSQHINAKSADPHLGVIRLSTKVDKGLLIESLLQPRYKLHLIQAREKHDNILLGILNNAARTVSPPEEIFYEEPEYFLPRRGKARTDHRCQA
jgi:hypothetical protein